MKGLTCEEELFTRLAQLEAAEGWPHGCLRFPCERKQGEMLMSALRCPAAGHKQLAESFNMDKFRFDVRKFFAPG